VIYEGTREIHTVLQAEYALGYREDKPLSHPQLPASGYELADAAG
jgi:glutaryl-CoA dehydrogenase (non-decarboxylating)